MSKRAPDPNCEFCGGEGKVPSMEQVYAGEPHYADIGEEDCICVIENGDDEDFDDDLLAGAEEMGLTPDEAERAVEDNK